MNDPVQSFLSDLKDNYKKQQTKKRRRNDDDDDRQQRKNKLPRKHEMKKQRKETSSSNDRPKRSSAAPMDTAALPGASDNSALLVLQKGPANNNNNNNNKIPVSFDHRYILAPMVGASELSFRMLCRKYGAQLCYTPMMSAHKFARDAAYRTQEFQTTHADRPLVCHFAANSIQDFCAAAKQAEHYCDAIDLNLGWYVLSCRRSVCMLFSRCVLFSPSFFSPQRTAYVGHFGSYLLDEKDRQLICDMIRAATQVVQIPIFCKIRLLNTLPETIQLVQQLAQAGASLIAIHARHRASWERQGPGARDGPALLDQVTAIQKNFMQSDGISSCNTKIISNGNTITWQDVMENLDSTNADGIMSAEGILDNPALFLPQFGNRDQGEKMISVPDLLPMIGSGESSDNKSPILDETMQKKKRKLSKKLREIERIQEKVRSEGNAALNEREREKLTSKSKLEKKLAKLEGNAAKLVETKSSPAVSLSELYSAADDKLKLANEYLDLVERYPTKIRSVIFHTRRMIKDELVRYQLLEECLAAQCNSDVRKILLKVEGYRTNPESFVFDQEKAKQEKEALERKRIEEGKRKAYEARMMRKAKREGKSDLLYYLRIGAEVPTAKIVNNLKALPRDEAMKMWKERHSQHCLAFHLDEGGCKRGRGCAFLHVDCSGQNTFIEKDEVAG